MGTGRWSVHQFHPGSSPAETIPTAAIRSDIVQANTDAMPPPFDIPFA